MYTVYRFEREVSKWDERGNDIVVLAKEMSMMMMDMSDFTRYIIIYIYIYVNNSSKLTAPMT